MVPEGGVEIFDLVFSGGGWGIGGCHARGFGNGKGGVEGGEE